MSRPYDRRPYWARVWTDIIKSPILYLMLLPVVAYYFLFCYKPMYGALIAFMDFKPGRSIWQLEWVGFEHFIKFFKARDFSRLILNTINISVSSLLWGFWPPILLALLLNELRSHAFSRVVQTVSYMPHFISTVVICGMIHRFTNSSGVITQLLVSVGLLKEPIALLSEPSYFVPVYVLSGIWQGVGYGSIVYLAALTNISQELYEAAKIDGAGRWRQTVHVTLPGILPTIIIMLILRMGSVMSVGSDKILLLYNSRIYSAADVISTYVYRKGILDARYDFSTAVGIFNSIINFIMLAVFNAISRRVGETSLW